MHEATRLSIDAAPPFPFDEMLVNYRIPSLHFVRLMLPQQGGNRESPGEKRVGTLPEMERTPKAVGTKKTDKGKILKHCIIFCNALLIEEATRFGNY